MILRQRHFAQVTGLLGRHPVVAILGARQVGKTTLARQIMQAAPAATRFDLEDPDDLTRLAEPTLALAGARGLVVIDEVQRRPDLFPVLRVLVDRPAADARFLILGSASGELLRQSSESLAGRIAYHELGSLCLDEVGHEASDALWWRGGFPRAFLAATDAASAEWRRELVRTFLERDLPQLGIRVPATTMRRFWIMLAHYHAQTWNAAELSRAFGVAASTVSRYLDILGDALVVRQLPPWHENVGKRQVKAPRVFIADSGLLHTLLAIDSHDELQSHPKVGASWEGFVGGEVARRLGARRDECFFWATHAGAALDLLVVRGRRRLGFEIQRTTTPRTTRSMRAAIDSLGLEQLYVVHAGEHTFALDDGITAVAFARIDVDLASLDA